MKNYVKTLRLMLLMRVGVSGYALADDTTGLVRGKVIGSGDTVAMESVDRGITYGAQVIGGNFNVRSLPPGDYTVVLRDEGEELSQQSEQGVLVGDPKVRDPRDPRVRLRAAESLHRHLFVRDRLDHVRTGDEHEGGVVDHRDEVGDGGE